MKVHYINILLFAHPLNILEHNQRNHNSTTPHHIPKIPTTRSLCECELYAPVNYDNDPQMKSVMENFNKQTQQRLHEYDNRMKTTRQKCKDKCYKEIQKIILKDKLEKELMDKFATLQTDIQSDAIPTCVCEKSMADKVEKGCLKCTQNLGGIVAPSTGVLVGIAEGALYAWKPEALKAAIAAAMEAGMAAGKAAGEGAGVTKIISDLISQLSLHHIGRDVLEKKITALSLKDHSLLAKTMNLEYDALCKAPEYAGDDFLCFLGGNNGNHTKAYKVLDMTTKNIVSGAREASESVAESVTASKTEAFKATNMAAVNNTYGSCQTAITASIIAIAVIVLIMVIIYLILRYRRKKKMKKKLHYIKLLEE
ncbi:rifin [Plasmodium reichenowi]|uniref:Rifin n=1 Tax=Plasmodium reichenowi TaxID=5854 RepID=A0A060RM92_PLARE|nr:rifin [Plasmodium reichenowi]